MVRANIQETAVLRQSEARDLRESGSKLFILRPHVCLVNKRLSIRIRVVLHENHETCGGVQDSFLAVYFHVVPTVVGSSANDVLQLQFAGGIFDLFSVDVLLDFCKVQSLLPYLVSVSHKLCVRWNFAKGV